MAHFHFKNFPWPYSLSIAQELDPNLYQSWIRLKRFFRPKTGDLQKNKSTRHSPQLSASILTMSGNKQLIVQNNFFKPKCSVAHRLKTTELGHPKTAGKLQNRIFTGTYCLKKKSACACLNFLLLPTKGEFTQYPFFVRFRLFFYVFASPWKSMRFFIRIFISP